MIATVFQLLKWMVILAVSCCMLLAGCHPSKFKTSSAQVSQVVLVSPSDPPSFNYAINDSPYSIFPFIYKGLIDENVLTHKLEPGLAENWTISSNRLRITFTLKSGLKWSDGKPLTADDIVFTYRDIYLNKKIPTIWRDFLRIGNKEAFPKVQKISDRQIDFILPEPFTPFLRNIEKLAILPAHALRPSVFRSDTNGNPQFLSTWGTNTPPEQIISNGPYLIESYIPSERAILRRNPYYWRHDAGGNQLPYIERIVWQIISSTDNQLIKFRSGELDNLEVTPSVFRLLKKEEKRGKYTIYNGGLSDGFAFVGFNLNQARNAKGQPLVNPIKSRWFNNLAFRQAVAYAINRQRMKINIYQGLGEVQHSPISVQSPYYLSPTAGLKVYNYNPSLAKQMLLETGFKYNSQQELIDRDGNRIEFNILVKSEERSRIEAAVQIQQDLNQIGIKTALQVVNFNVVLRKLLSQRDWDCYVGAFGVPGADVEPNLVSLFWTSQGSFHQFNQGTQAGEPPLKGWVVSDWEREINSLFSAGIKEIDENKRKAIYGKFQQIVAEQLPVFCLVNPMSFEAVRDRIKPIKYSSLGSVFWNIDEWKVSNE